MKPSVLFLLLAVPVLYGAAFLGLRPSLNNDAGMGFTVLQSMRDGAPFNVLVEPDSADIAKDAASFVAAWSPSQYALPALFQLIGLDLGQAIVLTVVFCAGIGIVGWYGLYRAMEFSPAVALLSCLLLELFQPFLFPFEEYNGGEIVMFAAAPWSALLVWSARDAGWVHRFLAVLTALALATAAKLSGLIFVSALLAGLAAYHGWRAFDPSASSGRRPAPLHALRALTLATMPSAVAWLLFVVAFRVFWTSRGWTAVDQPLHPPFALSNIYFPVVATVLSSSGFGAAMGAVSALPASFAKLLGEQAVAYAIALPFCALWLGMLVQRLRAPLGGTLWFMLAACAAYVACFMVLYHIGVAIYFDDRFYRPASLILLPGLVATLAATSSRPIRYLGGAFILAMACYGVAAGAWHIASVERRPVGMVGVRQPIASPGLLIHLHMRFGSTGERRADRVVYLPSPEMTLEVRGVRTISTFADHDRIETLRDRKYLGRVGELVIVLPATFLANGKADAILRSFRDYAPDRWKRTLIDDRFVEFSQ